MINLRHCLYLFFFISLIANAQQSADQIKIPEFENSNFSLGNGPKIFIDQSHYNFHQKSGRFKPFSDLLTADGYQVDSIINLKNLDKSDVLVISNPIDRRNIRNWRQPIFDAFDADEILLLKKWVKEGGRLLLIADHMPFAGATNTLANAFGFNFCDGFAYLEKEQGGSPDIFSIENKRLISSEITEGLNRKKINEITTFTGSSFTIPKEAKGILKFVKEDYCLAPEIAWQFNEGTPRTDLLHSYQGAILNYGKGKIAVFGEAAMFTAQTVTNNSGTFKFGFHSSQAPNNIQFIRNLLFWLSEK